MAKNRNKGFSLIEIIVAIAILTLLITPVVGQFSQTIKTNRKAKEQQKATENASYVIEFFQKTSLKEPDALFSNDMDMYCVPGEDGKLGVSKSVTCKLYTVDASDDSTDEVGQVEYTATKYTLNDKVIYGDVEYARTVVLDDLSNKIMAAEIGATKDSYRVKYDNEEAIDDFELTNEGSLVKRDENGYVVGIVCDKLDTANVIQDPNTISTGNMHDLDSKYVALVNGSSTNFDEQAERALYAKAVNRLKEIDEDTWKQQVYGENEGILKSYGYINGLKKLTKIYIDEKTDENGDEYYIVKVDVYYENEVEIHSDSDNAEAGEVQGSTNKDDASAGVQLNSSGNDTLTYNVYSQKFYKKNLAVDKCPDIYFEYQPFLIDKYYDEDGRLNIEYSSNEYVLMDNYVDGVKIYFYKPKYDQSYVELVGPPDEVIPEDSTDIQMSAYSFYKVNNNSDDFLDVETYSKKDNVNINICNSHVDSSTSLKKLNIYTNLDVAINGTNPQFVTETTFDVFKDAAQTEGSASNGRFAFSESNEDYIESLDKDLSVHERIYTITVTLTPDDDFYNTIVLTGAKEEN